MSGLSGKHVLVTGASGIVAFPVAVELAKHNEVYAVARYSDPRQKNARSRRYARDCIRPIDCAVAPPGRR
jgi:nucleoside-diphosphate-sugar epimerase